MKKDTKVLIATTILALITGIIISNVFFPIPKYEKIDINKYAPIIAQAMEAQIKAIQTGNQSDFYPIIVNKTGYFTQDYSKVKISEVLEDFGNGTMILRDLETGEVYIEN